MKIKLTISKKIFLGYGIITIGIILYTLVILVSMRRNLRSIENVQNVYNPSEKYIQDLKTNIEKSYYLIKNWVYIDKIPETPEKLELANIQDSILPKLFLTIENISNKWEPENRKLFKDIQKSVLDTLFPAQKQLMQTLGSFEDYDDAMAVFEAQSAVSEGGELAEADNRVKLKILELQKEIYELSVQSSNNLAKTTALVRKIIPIAILLLFLLAIAVPIITSRKIIRPILKLQEIILKMSTGHLPENAIVETGDEIEEMSKALNILLGELKKITLEIKHSSSDLDMLSKNLTKQAEIISRGASEQAASVEEVAAGIEEMVANIEQNTDNANTAKNIVKQAAEKIKMNNENVSNTVSALQKILEKIQIVNDIAFQTNILSLNASIEAARAGKNGKGFAVVAAEVGFLADKSKESSEDIQDLSDSSIKLSEESQMVSQALVPEILKTEELIRLVASTGLELKNGVNQINDAINSLNTVTQQNAVFADDMAQNSQSLAKQADNLVQMVAFFKN